MRDIVNSVYFDCKRDVAYDIEEAIDFLLHKEEKKSQRGALLSYLFAVFDSIDQNKLRKRLDRIRLEIFRATDKVSRRKGLEPWSGGANSFSTSRKQLDVGESIMSPVIRKVIALASQEQITSFVRRQARCVRDEMSLLQVYVKYLESKELRGEEMA